MYFFFNDTATTEIYTLSLHDALPIFIDKADLRENLGAAVERVLVFHRGEEDSREPPGEEGALVLRELLAPEDRKSTRLNSSHANISYAVFCLKKKKILFLRSSSQTPS